MGLNYCPLCGSNEIDEYDFGNDSNGEDVVIFTTHYKCPQCHNKFYQEERYVLKNVSWEVVIDEENHD